jgi:hypothetical protein
MDLTTLVFNLDLHLRSFVHVMAALLLQPKYYYLPRQGPRPGVLQVVAASCLTTNGTALQRGHNFNLN